MPFRELPPTHFLRLVSSLALNSLIQSHSGGGPEIKEPLGLKKGRTSLDDSEEYGE